MNKPKKGRKVALLAGLALVVLSVVMVWTYWKEIGFFAPHSGAARKRNRRAKRDRYSSDRWRELTNGHSGIGRLSGDVVASTVHSL